MAVFAAAVKTSYAVAVAAESVVLIFAVVELALAIELAAVVVNVACEAIELAQSLK